MGYKSDVRISLSINGFQELSNYIDDFFEKNNVDDQYNILHCMDVSQIKGYGLFWMERYQMVRNPAGDHGHRPWYRSSEKE